MHTFRFRLDRVREFRRAQLEMEECALGRLLGESLALVARREQLLVERRRHAAELTRSATLDARELAAFDAYRNWTKVEAARLAAKITDCDARILAQRQRVLEARRNFVLLSKLTEPQLTAWRRAAGAELESLAAEAYAVSWLSRASPPR